MEKLKILLADSHQEVLSRLAVRLSREPDFEIVGQVSSSGKALNFALENKPDIILIDPMMHDGFGLANLRQIISRVPEVAVVVLTAYVDTSLKMDLGRMGVSHILAKSLTSEKLIDILRNLGNKNPSTVE